MSFLSGLVDSLTGLQGALVYAIVGLLVFAEDAFLAGLVVPGETAAILGGVSASRGNASVVLLSVVVVVAAVLGDAVAYEIGVRFGPRLTGSRLLRRRRTRVERAQDFLRRRGGSAVFAGRFVAYFRTVIPFLAGSSHVRYRRFFVYNFAGAVIWGTGSVLIGFIAGDSYRRVEQYFGPVTAIVAAVLLIGALVVWQVRRHRAS